MPETVTLYLRAPMPLQLHHPSYPAPVIVNGGNHPESTCPDHDRSDRTGHTPGVDAQFWHDWCQANAGNPLIATTHHAEPITPVLWATPEESNDHG